MPTPRYVTRGYRGGRRGLSAIELSLALSVIVGLLYVSMRIMALPSVAIQPGTVVMQTGVMQTGAPTAAARTE